MQGSRFPGSLRGWYASVAYLKCGLDVAEERLDR
jgi:hypothetical protein